MNPTSSLSSNPRARYDAYLRYESIILAAFKSHPVPFRYRPPSLKPSTVCSRIRDAIRGAITFSHCKEIPVTDLARWWEETCVRISGDEVIIGPPQAVATEALTVPSNQPSAYTYPSLTLEEISAFSILLANNRISGPVVITVPPIDIDLLPPRTNVERVPRPDGSLVLL